MAKKAIIIGATSGIGNSLARIMSQKGWELGVTGRRANLLDELVRALPNKVYASDFDIVEVEPAREKLLALIEEMGGVDVVIINSGVGRVNKDINWEQELLTIDVNVRGFSAMATAAFKFFKKAGKGHIVGISSIVALEPSGNAVAYAASKSYVSSYIGGLRKRADEMNLDIVMTDIKPGFVDTPMTKGNPFMFWVSSSDKAAGQILNAIESEKEHAYVTRRWRLVGWALKLIPSMFLQKI